MIAYNFRVLIMIIMVESIMIGREDWFLSVGDNLYPDTQTEERENKLFLLLVYKALKSKLRDLPLPTRSPVLFFPKLSTK